MKKLSFISLFFLWSIYSNAQPYKTLPDSNATWVIQNDNGFGGYNWYNYSTPVHKEDTIINARAYTKIFEVYPNINYCGALRSDTFGKAFIVPKDSLQEYLLQDLSKNTGDSVFNVYFNIPPYGYQINFRVDSMDHITIGPYSLKRMFLGSNSNQIQLMCGSQYFPLIWIEKIGSAGGGFFNNITCGLGGACLYCMSFNDTIYYKSFFPGTHPDTLAFYTSGNCEVPLGLNQINQIDDGISLSPNPVYNESSLKLNNAEDIINQMDIYNSLGEKIKECKNVNNIKFQINKKQFPLGIYIAKIITKKGKIYSMNFIVL